jgi:hypothetical protein
MILNLDNFDGNIKLDGNTFSNNFLKYKSCDTAGVDMDLNINNQTLDTLTSYGIKNLL